MSDDLVNELLNLGPDDSGFREVGVAAATALTEARAEIERLTEQALVKDHAIIEAAKLAKKLMTRVAASESELSTLRARVREVVAPLARLTVPEKPQGNAGAYSIFHNDIRAARQLMEEVK